MSKHKQTQYTFLIICEGTNTAPNYFSRIKEEVTANGMWTEGVSIDIRLKPPFEIEAALLSLPNKELRFNINERVELIIDLD